MEELTVTDAAEGKEGKEGKDGKVEVPAVETAAGPPEGEVVFDHPPSQGERDEVRKSLEGR
jgi:hypothetical protein